MRRVRWLCVGVVLACTAACGGGSHTTAPRVVTNSTATHDSVTTSTLRAPKPTKQSHATTTTRPPTSTTQAAAPAHVSGGAPSVVVPIGSAGTSTGRKSPTTVKPFDPTQDIDLSGTPGVTPAQQKAAETLLRNTLRDLPRFASQSAAYAAGYRTIGDAATGDEHWVNWAYAWDSDVLDSKHPESLVYNTRTPGHPVLEAAMYMFPPGTRFTDIPEVDRNGLMQFHVHNDICFERTSTSGPLQLTYAGSTDSSGKCRPGTILAGNVPMIHAWIVKNPCGPFAALSGIAGGQVPEGETVNCDSAHAGVL